MEWYARWIIRRRRAVLAVVIAATLAFAWAATRLHVEVDADRQLPQSHPYIRTLNEVHRVFGDKNLVVVGLFPHDGRVFTPQFLAKLAEITRRLETVPGVNPALVQSLAAPSVKVIRGTADGFEVERVMELPPVDQEGAESVRRRAFENPAYVGTLVSADGAAAAVHATFELTPQTPGYRHLHEAVLAAVSAAQDGTFDVRLSGPVVFLSQLSAYASRMAHLFPIALLVIGLVHYDAFRTLQAMFLPLLTAVLSVVWALGLMGALGVPLDPFNTTTPILILAVAAGHAVQVLKRFYEEYDACGDVHEAVVRALRRVGPVMLAAGVVAALSFASLITFGTATIRTFGLFTGFGIVSALIIEMTIIPAVRASLGAPHRAERTREAAPHRAFDWFIRLAASLADGGRARMVLFASGVVLAACAVLAWRIDINTSLKREFSTKEPIRVDDAILNRQFAGTNTLLLLVEGNAEGAMQEPTIMRAILGLQRRLEKEAGVGKAVSYVDFVRQMHVAMNADKAVDELPDSRALAAQYLFLYSMSGGGQDFDTILDPTHRIAKVRVLVRDDATAYGERLIALVNEIVRETFPPGYRVGFTGTIANTAAATEVMVSGKLQNIMQIAVITIVASSLLLRSVVGGLLVAVPLVLAVAVNFGVMGLLGIPLDTMTSVISAMAVGIGADYAMYFLFRLREELKADVPLATALARALGTSGKAVLFVSSAIAAGYVTLCLSRFALHVQLGGLVALAMAVSSAAALLVLPAIVVVFRPSFLLGRTSREQATVPRWPQGIRPVGRETADDRRPSLPPEFYRVSSWRSAAFVSTAVILFIGGGTIATEVATSGIPLPVRVLVVSAAMLVAAHGLHLLGWVGHEGIHLTLHRNKYVSTIVGCMAQAMAFSSAVGYALSHWNHHRYTNQASDPDVELFPTLRTFWRRFFLARVLVNRTYLRMTIAAARGQSMPLGYKLPFTPRAQRILAVANLVFLGFWVVVYGIVAVYRPYHAVFGIVVPALFALPMTGLRIYVEHGGTMVGLGRDTRSYTSPVYTCLFLGNNYHLEHHLYPTVPCYNLPAVHRFLAANGFHARWGSPVDGGILGPLMHTTARSQYPGSPGFDAVHDPFAPAITPAPRRAGSADLAGAAPPVLGAPAAAHQPAKA